MTTPTLNYKTPGVYVQESLTPLSPPASSALSDSAPAFVGYTQMGPSQPYLVSSWTQFKRVFGGFSPTMNLPYAVFSFFNNGGGACYVSRMTATDAQVAQLVLVDINGTPHNALTVRANAVGAWGNTVSIEVIAANPTSSGQVRSTVNIRVGSSNTAASNPIVETFADVSVNPGDSRYLPSIINSPVSGSAYVVVIDNKVTTPGWTYTAGIDDLAALSPTFLSGGSDSLSSVPQTDPTAAVQALASVADGVNLLVNLPETSLTSSSAINALITWAAGLGTVMLVLDAPYQDPLSVTASAAAQAYVTAAQNLTASSYVGVYGPWLRIADPASSVTGSVRTVPPGGSVLGQYSLSDKAFGPWKTPAGTSTAITGVIDLQFKFSSADTDLMNTGGVNVIRPIPGAGMCVMGGRTLRTGYPDRYISVRRTLMMIRRNLVAICRPQLFAPNGPSLWLTIAAQATQYLTQIMQQGALAGNTPATSFYVVCDSTNNPSSTTGVGQVNLEVGVALLSPAEFIVITIGQFDGSTSVTDSSG